MQVATADQTLLLHYDKGPTEKGHQLLLEDYQRFIAAFSSVSENLGEEKTELLCSLLEQFSDCVEQEIRKEAGDDA